MTSGVRCTLSDPIECTGRNPVCVFSKHTGDYRCCSDVPQDLSNPPGIPEQVKPSQLFIGGFVYSGAELKFVLMALRLTIFHR